MRETDIDRWTTRFLPVLVAAGTLAAFAPALDDGWVAWDDPLHFLNNPFYRGLGRAQLRWMFEGPHLGQYFPVTWLTLGLDYKLWGMEPYGYHATSVLIQAAVAVALYFVARRLLALAVPRADARDASLAAAVAALAFAVHPLRVESVAWITERRDLVSGLFYLLAIDFYLRARATAPARAWRWRAASLVAFAASLLSKAIGFTLPAALLILDAWPLGRFSWPPTRWGKRERDALVEKVPYALLSAACAVAAWAGLRGDGTLRGVGQVGLGARLAQASFGFLFYPFKTLWPTGLIPVYEQPRALSLASPPFAACFVACAAIAAAAWIRRRERPAVSAALAFYAVALAPVSGLVSNGLPYLAVDRYSYLPALSFAVLGGGLFLSVARRRRAVALAATGAILFSWIALSRAQCAVWRDSASLWGHALSIAPNGATALVNEAVVLSERGDWNGAEALARRATRARPEDFAAWANLGSILARRGRFADAEDALTRAAALRPNAESIVVDRGLAIAAQGRDAEAAAAFRSAVALDDSDARAWYALGNALGRRSRGAEAESSYRRAIELDPAFGDARVNLGMLLASRGRVDEAAAQFRAALSSRGAAPRALFDWGVVLAARGDATGAEKRYAEAVRLDPDFLDARFNYGNALARSRRWREAAAQYRAILARDPGARDARASLDAVRKLGGF